MEIAFGTLLQRGDGGSPEAFTSVAELANIADDYLVRCQTEAEDQSPLERLKSHPEMTPERITAFYKQTASYIYELAEWHLFVPGKRESDLALFDDMRAKQPKNIIDFGGGVGLLAVPLARAGFDVTLADLDSTTLRFALFRAERHGIRLKVWKSDVEPTPPDKKYDVILALDVLEHLPKDELDAVVDKLIQLKHAKTEIILSAPFGRTEIHPMHIDADEHTNQQVHRLQTELPKE